MQRSVRTRVKIEPKSFHGFTAVNSIPFEILCVSFRHKRCREDCEVTTSIQIDIMKNQIPLPDMKWSVKDINKFIQHPLIHSMITSYVMTYDTQYNNREIGYIDHNYSSDVSKQSVSRPPEAPP